MFELFSLLSRPRPTRFCCATFTGLSVLLALLLGAMLSCPAAAQETLVGADDAASLTMPKATEPVYPVTRFTVLFDREVKSAGLDSDKLKQHTLVLSQVDGVYTQPQPGAQAIVTTLAKLDNDTPNRYDVTALRTIIDGILGYLNDEAKLIGVVVAPAPSDIGLDLQDRRGERTELTLIVRLASVGQVRTLASGDRIDQKQREDNLLHTSIRERSPLQASTEPRSGSLLLRDELDHYLYRLNRHPGRRVDAAISPGLSAGEVSLDYLVAENKPWYVYFQLSNTGTDSTDEIRERFGLVHNQLTARDDILSIDYITASFDESHVLTVNYTRPFNERLELRLNGLYSEFSADQVGSPLAFTGEDVATGATLAYNVYQNGPLFVDAVAGLEYYFTSANNPGAGVEGEANLLMASAGFEMERSTDLSQTFGLLKVRGNINQGDRTDFASLGRTAPDTQFALLQYGLTTSFYIEPLINAAAWRDITDPTSSTLAHELAFGVRGQLALEESRLVPTFQAVAGGLTTVRGYEQADVAGDSSVILTAEYRFHLPRAFGVRPPQQTKLFDRPFRFAPEAVYGRPDWDLVLKAFVDYAYVDVSNELAFETDDSLLSTGLGVELALKNNINLRADWGVALEDAGSTRSGDNRLHLVLTLLY